MVISCGVCKRDLYEWRPQPPLSPIRAAHFTPLTADVPPPKPLDPIVCPFCGAALAGWRKFRYGGERRDTQPEDGATP